MDNNFIKFSIFCARFIAFYLNVSYISKVASNSKKNLKRIFYLNLFFLGTLILVNVFLLLFDQQENKMDHYFLLFMIISRIILGILFVIFQRKLPHLILYTQIVYTVLIMVEIMSDIY